MFVCKMQIFLWNYGDICICTCNTRCTGGPILEYEYLFYIVSLICSRNLMTCVSCEQALYLGDIVKSKRCSRLRHSLARSRAARFARPNRRACLQAITCMEKGTLI